MRIDSNPTLNGGLGTAATISASNITINANGILSADQCGFRQRGTVTWGGPGYGEYYERGASYGGIGYQNTGLNETYGSVSNPICLGSDGGGGTGGGAIILDVTNNLIVNGTITCDGSDDYHGGGSGGSINITCDSLSGSGVIRAEGGGPTRSGAGGRILIKYSTNSMKVLLPVWLYMHPLDWALNGISWNYRPIMAVIPPRHLNMKMNITVTIRS